VKTSRRSRQAQACTWRRQAEAARRRACATRLSRCALDAESQALISSETAQDEFKEVDGLLLPAARRALVARDGLCRSAEIKLSNLEVERAPAPEPKAPAGG
jgi:hypothetical protein